MASESTAHSEYWDPGQLTGCARVGGVVQMASEAGALHTRQRVVTLLAELVVSAKDGRGGERSKNVNQANEVVRWLLTMTSGVLARLSPSNGAAAESACSRQHEGASLASSTPALRSVTFEGGGFRTISYLGWMARRYGEGCLGPGTVYYGTSMGAVYAAAAALLLYRGGGSGGGADGSSNSSGADDFEGFRAFAAFGGELIRYCADVADEWQANYGSCAARLRRGMEEHFPEDITRAQGRVQVCITRFTACGLPRKCIVSEFESMADLISAISASAFIPLWNVGLPSLARPWRLLTRFRGSLACDGTFVDNSPAPLARGAGGARGAAALPPAEANEAAEAAAAAAAHETVYDAAAPLHQCLFPPVMRRWPPEVGSSERAKGTGMGSEEAPPWDSAGLLGSLAEIARGFAACPARARPPAVPPAVVSRL